MNVLQAALARVSRELEDYRAYGGEASWKRLDSAIENVRRIQAAGPPYPDAARDLSMTGAAHMPIRWPS